MNKSGVFVTFISPSNYRIIVYTSFVIPLACKYSQRAFHMCMKVTTNPLANAANGHKRH